MSFTRSTTDVNVHRNMPDYPSGAGITTTQLKTAFDSSAEGLKTDLNGLMTELEDTTAADNLGAAQIGDEVGTTVQDKLEYLQSELQGIALGDIPAGTITQGKLDSTYEATLAKKDGTLQSGLSAEMLNGKTEAQLESAFFTTVDATTLSYTKLETVSTTTTETKTVSTGKSRYYVLTFGGGYNEYAATLYDARSNKFAFAINRNNTGVSNNVGSLRLFWYSQDLGATLTASYSSGVLTLNVTKKTGSSSSSATPAGTITVYELGGKVL